MNDRDLSCNFLEYLEWRLGQEAETTAQLLGEWLATYEPQRPNAGTRARERLLADGLAGKLG